jgi:hypothetical protein
MKFGLTVIGAVLLAGTVTFAQSGLDTASLERRLQDAEAAITATSPAGIDRELQELQDELAYLRVKARRGMTITTAERRAVSDRIDRFSTRVRTNAANNNGINWERSRDTQRAGRRMIPVGTEVDVRLQTRLSSEDNLVEDRVEATTLVDLYEGDQLIVPAGSLLAGYVSSVDKASRTDRTASITVLLNRLTVNGRTHDVRATVTQALEAGGVDAEASRVGAGAGVGAIIGGILGGVKGAITGVLIGGGGVLAATEGKDVKLEPGTVLRVRFDSAVPLGR